MLYDIKYVKNFLRVARDLFVIHIYKQIFNLLQRIMTIRFFFLIMNFILTILFSAILTSLIIRFH